MLSMLFTLLGRVRAETGIQDSQDVPVVTTTILLIAGAGLLKQSTLACRRRKGQEDETTKWPKSARFQRSYSETDMVDDAETCWKFEYGKFKYTGLRPEPLEPDAEPPVPLSIEEAEQLEMPQLREGEEEKIWELKELVADLKEQQRHRVDNLTLMRFLRAEKGKVHKAEKKIRDAISWMEENDVLNALDKWNLEAYEKCLAPWWLSGGFLGHGLQGEPVALERIGRCSWPKLCARLDFEVLKRLDIVHCRRSLAALEEDSLRRGRPFGGATVVLDLKGFKWSDAQFGAAWTLSKIVACRSNLLPEICTRILFVRVPSPFVKAWSMFSYLLDPGTIAKVQMATEAETLSLLRKYMGDETIPAYLGGQRHTDGDPYCRKLLAPGGFPPEAALHRFERLVAGDDDGDFLDSSSRGGRDGRDTRFQLDNASRHYIDQSVRYLLLGVVLGVLGFLIVVPLMLRGLRGTMGSKDINKTFLPATVSELVSEWHSVEARIFFGFELLAALSILLSWYPYKLRNACCIPAQGGCRMPLGPCAMSWATARTFFPPVGLVLVACVPSVRQEEWDSERLVLVVVHCCSAMLMFISFLLAEAHALCLRPLKCKVEVVQKGTLQYKLRYGTWLLAAWPYFMFSIIQIYNVFVELQPYARITSFVLEVDAGLAMLANHFAIWPPSENAAA
ncbi:unnamed protein product [Effrenium voratum]|nr:unnamed protein product [Effrenium voratum]